LGYILVWLDEAACNLLGVLDPRKVKDPPLPSDNATATDTDGTTAAATDETIATATAADGTVATAAATDGTIATAAAISTELPP